MSLTAQQAAGIGVALIGAAVIAAALTSASWGDAAPAAPLGGPTVEMAAPSPEPVAAPVPEPAMAPVRGQVYDADGFPVEGAVAKLDTEHGSFAAQTTRGGKFTIQAPTGRHLLYATRLVGQDELLGPPLLIEVREPGVVGFPLTLPASGTVGVGVVLDLRGNDVVVTWAQEGRAAWDAGVRAGDQLLAIDGGSTDRMGLRDIERAIQGRLDTDVALTLAGDGGATRAVVVRRRSADQDDLPLDGG